MATPRKRATKAPTCRPKTATGRCACCTARSKRRAATNIRSRSSPASAEGTINAPDHSFPSFVNFIFSATDARGLSAEISRKVEARPVPLQIHSEPPGIDIGVGETHLVTPAEYKAIEGSPTTVAAPIEETIGGVKYVFQRWSDGGARVHEVSSTAPGTYTAIYAAVEETGGGGDIRIRWRQLSGGGNSSGGGAPSGGGSGSESKKSGPPARPKLKSGPAKRTRSTTARFVFGGSAGNKFMCKLDGGKFAACRSPKVYKKLKPGRHKVSIYATSGSGGRSATTVFSWKIVAAG